MNTRVPSIVYYLSRGAYTVTNKSRNFHEKRSLVPTETLATGPISSTDLHESFNNLFVYDNPANAPPRASAKIIHLGARGVLIGEITARVITNRIKRHKLSTSRRSCANDRAAIVRNPRR